MLDDGPLSPEQVRALESAESTGQRLGISAISLWEISKLHEKGRIRLHISVDDFLTGLETHPGLEVLPLSSRIALESTRLGPRFHQDPADQLIAATARVHGMRLATVDRRIRDSGAVSTV
jgi:PIN domain nuclease of toxin-antitoxin system